MTPTSLMAMIAALLTLAGCTNGEEPEGTPPTDSAAISELPVSAGSVGLVVDVRRIAKHGYAPSTVAITFEEDYADFSTILGVNADTSVATLRIAVETLTESQLEVFADGVEATLEVEDPQGEVLASLTDTVVIDSSNVPIAVPVGDLPGIYAEPEIRPGVPYLVQAVDPDSPNDGLLVRLHIDENFEPGLDPMVLDIYRPTLAPYYELFFEDDGNGAFHLRFVDPDDGVDKYLEMSPFGNLYTYYNTSPVDSDVSRFAVERTADGNLRLHPASGHPIIDNPEPNVPGTTYHSLRYADTKGDGLELRIVAANVEWSVEDRGTAFSDPVLPPAKLDFAFRSLLSNCSSAELTETVGKAQSQTRSTTIGTEESLELYSSQEASVDVTAGVSATGSFFGQSVTASLEVSTGYSYTTSSTQTSTNTWEETVEETIEVSRVREVQIPPFTAVEVYDAVQTIENVRLPFVQVLRVRGQFDGVDPLSGAEVVDQLLANQFGGVVTDVADDFAEVSVRGTVAVDNFFEAESRVNELEGACDE